ncbi:hypothetical protein, partial [Methanobrevibacter sp.]|uniref:hypothetical protein n=1 Tax=Methanobrevibacter sp. TaxID=66852 RepID=UPI00388EA60A
MKSNKYLIVLSIFLISLVFISSASAADANDSDVLSIDESVNIESNDAFALDSVSNDNNVLGNTDDNLSSALCASEEEGVLGDTPKKDLNVSGSADPIYAGENATVVITGFEDATGNVSALVNLAYYNAPIVDGVATFITKELSRSATAYVLYLGDDLYKAAFTSVNITVLPAPGKKDLNLSGSAEPINVGENATVVISGFEDATGNVSALVNLAYYNVPIVDGVATFITKELSRSATAYVLYLGDDLYKAAFTSVNITVLPAPAKKDLNLSGSAEPIYVGENATVVITGFEDATGNVSALVNLAYYNAPIVDGVATFITKELSRS